MHQQIVLTLHYVYTRSSFLHQTIFRPISLWKKVNKSCKENAERKKCIKANSDPYTFLNNVIKQNYPVFILKVETNR